MKEATLIYPHQLFKVHPAVTPGRLIYLVEEPLFVIEFPIHRQKLLLHRLSMQAYKQELEEVGYQVRYLAVATDITSTGDVFTLLKKDGVEHLHVADVTDYWLAKRIITACIKEGIGVTWYESPLFILAKEDAIARYKSAKKYLATFYKKLRIDTDILVTENKEPVGGQWSFDADNRQKFPKGFMLPDDPGMIDTSDVTKAKEWLATIGGEQYGTSALWLPYTRVGAEGWLQTFFQERFENFGTYEDAIAPGHTLLFHSGLSALINIGLLSPQYVIDEALQYAKKNQTPMNSLEGFIRQILGWREFIRAAYECDGVAMRTKNFWQHTRKLPAAYWTGETGILPVDAAISRALQFGYNHHIERLMVLGNVMLLSQINPDDVYQWFMAMYVDAYDWVMVPNVYGMSQFADGGLFATKPYISGSNYIKKMSSYSGGEWEEIWTALYWNFIATHQDFFLKNHRLSMMPRLLEKMNPEKKIAFKKIATDYLESH